jgi:hypothetical protein
VTAVLAPVALTCATSSLPLPPFVCAHLAILLVLGVGAALGRVPAPSP